VACDSRNSRIDLNDSDEASRLFFPQLIADPMRIATNLRPVNTALVEGMVVLALVIQWHSALGTEPAGHFYRLPRISRDSHISLAGQGGIMDRHSDAIHQTDLVPPCDGSWLDKEFTTGGAYPSLRATSEIGWRHRVGHGSGYLHDSLGRLWEDYRNFYGSGNLTNLMWGVAAGSILANTSLDQNFQDWYQQDVRSSGLDDVSSLWRSFGEGQVFIPAYVGMAALGALSEDWQLGQTVGDFGARTVRAYGVGAPPMLLLQYTLGASRPGETRHQSRWKPFDDSNAVSGHAFVGAVPFLTAAKMTEDRFLKSGLYFCSTLTAWSRVNDDCHYLSQACLGWWTAYLACEAVNKTGSRHRPFAMIPVETPEMVGVGLVFQR
jgi:hypothetical protein